MRSRCYRTACCLMSGASVPGPTVDCVSIGAVHVPSAMLTRTLNSFELVAAAAARIGVEKIPGFIKPIQPQSFGYFELNPGFLKNDLSAMFMRTSNSFTPEAAAARIRVEKTVFFQANQLVGYIWFWVFGLNPFLKRPNLIDFGVSMSFD